MEQLKSQIKAYKLIARNAPVPKYLLFKATQKKEGLLPLSYDYPMKIEFGEKLPYDLMKVFALHQQQAKRVTTLFPPPGIDPQVILREREIQNRIGLRIAERTKRQSLREARVTEKLKQQQKMEQERMRRQRHMELLQAILQHGRDFKEFHRNIQVKQSKVKKAILIYHANSERERKRKEQQKERERLQKLMQEDEEGYRLLFDEEHQYVANLTGLVKQHQERETEKAAREKRRKTGVETSFQ
uniref:Uncharacterized protein n=1 Tax=Acrobeloides nanus TaxID=290746 RepID=A0A914C7G8_9BILA